MNELSLQLREIERDVLSTNRRLIGASGGPARKQHKFKNEKISLHVMFYFNFVLVVLYTKCMFFGLNNFYWTKVPVAANTYGDG